MNWIALLLSIEAGFMPLNGWVDNNNQSITENQAYYITIEPGILAFDHLYIGGKSETYMHTSARTFRPVQTTFTFTAQLRFEKIIIGFDHVCGPHPIHTYPSLNDKQPTSPFEGSYEKIYIKFSNRY